MYFVLLLNSEIMLNIHYNNQNITIAKNYISQNRYGLTAIDVDTLIVKENIFIQKFPDNSTRKFWTDNQILLTNVSNLIWKDNLYKEAYSQDNEDENTQSSYFVTFPTYHGVVL